MKRLLDDRRPTTDDRPPTTDHRLDRRALVGDPGEGRSLAVDGRSSVVSRRSPFVALAALGLLAFLGDYALTVLTEIAVLVLFAVSLHFIMGPAGMASFGHAAWFGVRMIGGGLACLVHAVFPFLCVRTGSQMMNKLHSKLHGRADKANWERHPII